MHADGAAQLNTIAQLRALRLHHILFISDSAASSTFGPTKSTNGDVTRASTLRPAKGTFSAEHESASERTTAVSRDIFG